MPKKFKQAVKLATSKLATSKPATSKSDERAALASAQQIWQASLGAFARAQQQSMGQGAALRTAGETVPAASNDAAAPADAPSWDRLEQVFEQRVARALASLGLPGTAELAALYQKIDALSAQVAALTPAKSRRKRAASTLLKPSARKKGASGKHSG